jgi:hypothetical protein
MLTGPTLHLQYISRADAVRIEEELAEVPAGHEHRADRKRASLFAAEPVCVGPMMYGLRRDDI